MKSLFYHNQDSLVLAKLLEPLQEDILEQWASDRIAGQILKSHNIDQKFFVKYFGSKVLEYFIKVLKDEEKIGQCPAIIVMLKFFAKKSITLQNLFLCCAGFKNSVTIIFLENVFEKESKIDFQKLRALQSVFDLNFSGVIQEYIYFGYCTVQCPKTFTNNIPENHISDVEEVEEMLQLSIVNHKELKTYDDAYRVDEFQEFTELEEDIIFLTNKYHAKNITYEVNVEYASKLTKYATIISLNPSFSDMGESIFNLAHLFSNNANFSMIEEKHQDAAILMDCFINDLILWKESLLVTGVEDMNYYDKSIITNVNQIIMLITDDIQSDNEGCDFF